MDNRHPVRCEVCHEPITRNGLYGWTHVHSNDTHCGTGDGATAMPEIKNESE